MAWVRCTRCRARRTLVRHPDAYTRPPQCRAPGCKSRRFTVDAYRTRMERGAKAPRPCRCLGYHFPHRSAAGRCLHNPSLEQWEQQEEPGYQPWSDVDELIQKIPF